MSRDERTWFLGVCALALLLRLAVVVACHDSRLFSDMEDYHRRALHLLAEGRLWPDAFRPPGYPVFLAGVYALAGELPLAVRVVQALLGTGAVWLTHGLARRLVGPGPAIGAALVVAVYPAWLLYTMGLMAENLFTPLILLGLWLWVREASWAVLAAGAVLSAATLTRAPGLAALGAIALVTTPRLVRDGPASPPFAAGWRPAGRRLVLFGVGAVLVLAPWAIRNYQLYGRLVLPDSASGHNFLLGNNPLASGTLEHEKIGVVAARYWQGARDDVERSRIGYQEGLRFVRRNPGRAAALAFQKLGYLAGLEGRDEGWVYSHGILGARSAPVVWGWGLAILVSFPLLMAVALPALVSPSFQAEPLGRGVTAILVGVALVHVASFGESRFHLPWVPLLAVAASWTVAGRLTRDAAGRPVRWTWRRRLALGAGAAGLLIAWGSQVGDLAGRLATLAGMARMPTPIPY